MTKQSALILLIGLIFGVILTTSISRIYAQVTSNVIHGCVFNITGILRVITQGNCLPHETPLSWNQQGPVGATGATGAAGPFPIFCGGCQFTSAILQDRLVGKNLSNSILTQGILNENNFSNVNFSNSLLTATQFSSSNLSNADLSNSYIDSVDFSNANLTNINVSNSNATGTRFWSTTMTNATASSAIFRQADFKDSNLRGSTFTGADFGSGGQAATWTNTICPDGTNSNNNGNTCIGHLNP